MAKRKAKTEEANGEAAPPEPVKIVSFKGFDKDFACRGHQFEVGKTYTVSGHIKACKRGFHACENPFDVWSYYPVGEGNRFAVVEQSGDISRHGSDSKIASASITVTAELTLPQFIRRAVDWVIEKTKGEEPQAGEVSSGDSARIGSSGDSARIGSSGHSARIGSSGHYAQIGSSGHSAQIGSSGDSARIGSSGDSAQIGSSGHSARIGSSGHSARIGSSGHYAQIGSSGHSAQIGSSGHSARIGSSGHSARIGSSGHYARIGSSGHYAQIGSSGHSAQIGSSGDSARIGSSGHYAQIDVEGENCVVASAGYNATVKGPDGLWVSLAEYVDGKCVGFATGCIGQDGLKAGVLYRASGGKLVKAA